MSGAAQSPEIARAPSPEASTAAPKESLGKRAAEGLQKAVGSAREKMKKWINGEDSAQQKRFHDALQRIPTREQVQTEVQAQAAEVKRQDDLNAANEGLSLTARMFTNENANRASGARAHSEAVKTINGTTSGEVHSSTGALAENQQQTQVITEGARARTQTANRLEAEQHARLNKQTEEQIQAAGTKAGSVETFEADKANNRAHQEQASASSHAEKPIEVSEAKQGLPKTQAELDGIIAKAVAEAVTKAVAEQNTQIAQLTLENEQLRTDLANTQEQVQTIVDKALAAALAAERAKPAAEAPKPQHEPETASQTPAKAAVVAEANQTKQHLQTEDAPDTPEENRARWKRLEEGFAKLEAMQQKMDTLEATLQTAQNGAQQAIKSLNVTDPAVKAKIEAERKKGSAANWLFIFPFVLGSAAKEKNKAAAGQAVA